MSVLTFVFLFFLLLYTIMVWRWTFLLGKERIYTPSKQADVQISVLVPFRNEEKALPSLLKALLAQNYPAERCTFYFLDDASDDQSAQIVQSYMDQFPHAHYVSHPIPIGKKAMIAQLIPTIQDEYILATDADAKPQKGWISGMISYFVERELLYLAGPVLPKQSESLPGCMIALEFFSLLAATRGSFIAGKAFMSNGANHLFARSAWMQVMPHTDQEKIASGDDVFLLQKIRSQFGAEKVAFYPGNKAAVVTQFPETPSGLWKQRLRWAGKTPHYNSLYAQWVAFLVFISSFIHIWAIFHSFYTFLLVWTVKGLTDYFILRKITSLYQQRDKLAVFRPLFIIYPFYTFGIGCGVLIRYLSQGIKGQNTIKNWR